MLVILCPLLAPSDNFLQSVGQEVEIAENPYPETVQFYHRVPGKIIQFALYDLEEAFDLFLVPLGIVRRVDPDGYYVYVEVRAPFQHVIQFFRSLHVALGQVVESHFPGIPTVAVQDETDMGRQYAFPDFSFEDFCV